MAPDPAPAPPSEDAHESLCRRCGICCFEKIAVGDLVLISDIPCPHLDLETRTCRVYARRTRMNGRCLSVAEAIAVRALPADCPYVRGRKDYQPPIPLSARPDLKDLIDETEAAEEP